MDFVSDTGFYNFDTQHAEFMNYIQMTTTISVNNMLAIVI